MNTFSEGDLIEATKPNTEEIYRARLHRGRISGELIVGQAGNIPQLILAGYTLKTIEKAAPALPTEPGVYLPINYGDVHTPNVWLLHPDGRWLELPNAAGHEVRPLEMDHLARAASRITRLEPVADTAKKVTQFVLDWIGAAGIYTDEQCFAVVAAEFGATS